MGGLRGQGSRKEPQMDKLKQSLLHDKENQCVPLSAHIMLLLNTFLYKFYK